MKLPLLILVLIFVLGIGIGISVGLMVPNKSGSGLGSDLKDGPLGPSGSAIAGGNASDRDSTRRIGNSSWGRSPVASVHHAIRILESRPPDTGKDDMLEMEAYGCIRWMNADEIKEAIGKLGDIESNHDAKRVISEMLLARWASLDGPSAMAFATDWDLPGDRGNYDTITVFREWVKSDEKGALAWFLKSRKDNKESGDQSNNGIYQQTGFFVELAHQNFAEAAREVEKLNADDAFHVIGNMAASLARHPEKREECLKWLAQMDDRRLRVRTTGSILGKWASVDLDGATQYLDSRDPESDEYADLKRYMVREWIFSSGDIREAIGWQVERLNETEPAGDQIADTFGHWALKNAESASEWLSQQPEGFHTDALYKQGIQSACTLGDTDMINQWLGKIENQATRARTMRDIHFRLQGDEALLQWLDSMDPSLRAEFDATLQLDEVRKLERLRPAPVR